MSCHDIGARLKGKREKKKRENENDFQSDICRTCVTDYVSEHTGHSSLETYLSLGSSTSSIHLPTTFYRKIFIQSFLYLY